MLTASQNVYWAVQVIGENGTTDIEFGKFATESAPGDTPFSAVTILTHGFTLAPTATGIPESHYEMANHIAKANGAENPGLILRYDKPTGNWIPVDELGRTLTNVVAIAPDSLGYMGSLVSAIKANYLNKPLVLLPEWSKDRESIVPDTGFTEAAADAVFAAIVALDKALMGPGDRASGLSQGALLDSPLHFIGFSRGAVVNSEIIQRLGTYYPHAGGVFRDVNGQVIRGDLQMTTIDPHDFDQPSLGPVYRDFKEPEVKVWENVTFADNYYQTIAPKDGTFTFTPRGREIAGIPEGASVKLDGRAGFTEDNKFGGPHTATFAWYAGTVGFDIDQISLDGRFSTQYPTDPLSYPIYDRAGEGDVGRLAGVDGSESLRPWYSQAGSSEGLGTGWFYSVLGGGKENRPSAPLMTTPVYQDNTSTEINRGNLAVPTLFNGDFESTANSDGIVRQLLSKDISGWSFHGSHDGDLDDPLGQLVDWSEITSLNAGLSGNNTAFRIQGGGNGGSGISHSPFLLPDWGAFRFDVHVPNPSKFDDLEDYIKITLETEEKTYHLTSQDLVNFSANPPIYPIDAPDFKNEFIARIDPNVREFIPAVDLREVESIFGIDEEGKALTTFRQPLSQSQVNRVGYASQGFETFHLNIPEEAYGRIAKSLKIEVYGDNVVFLDNIGFVSEHLKFGNPTLNGQRAGTNPNNYLIEKPEYASSFNNSLSTPNWVSYQIDKSWLRKQGLPNPSRETEVFSYDYSLPEPFRVSSYGGLRDGYGTNGHLVPRENRFHIVESYNESPDTGQKYYISKNNFQTFLTTNALPEFYQASTWGALENSLTEFIKNSNGQKEAFVVAGRSGTLGSDTTTAGDVVDIPEYLWKAILIPEEVGQGPAEINLGATAFGVLMRNQFQADLDWANSNLTIIVSIDELESITKLDLFSDIPDEIENVLESRIGDYTILPSPPSPSASLLSSEVVLSSSVMDARSFHIPSVGQHGFPEKRPRGIKQVLGNGIGSILGDISFGQIDVSEVGTFQDSLKYGSFKHSTSEIDIVHNTIDETAVSKTCPLHDGSGQVSIGQINQRKMRVGKLSSNQPGVTQINILEDSVSEPSSAQINVFQTNAAKYGIPRWIISDEVNASKSSLSSGISFQQVLAGHSDRGSPSGFHTLSLSLSEIYDSGCLLHFLEGIDVTFSVTNLSVGQLAETQITRFDESGHAAAGMIVIDDDANGRGWFIDPTPWESSEFGIQNTEYNFEAIEGSAAYGRYDLLTTILHELGHLAGFIAGHDSFDDHVHNHTFTDGDLTTALTADGSHLTDPLRLLSPYLTPGMRKLPSELELRILQAIRNHDGTFHAHGPLSAAQTATPLLGITNGDFEQLLDQWNHRGTVQTSAFNTSTAVTLTEDSPILSQLSQTFVIPQDASQRYLTFDLLETTLGNTTHRPPDAFEVALLNATTLKPLVGTAIGLTNTDALLNLQSNGTLYLDDDVTVTTLANGHRRVRIDLGDLATGLTNTPTTATLYFDLLGFGAADSRITIDNITFGKGSTPPVATDDTATLTQGQSTSLNLLTNDTADQPLTPSQLTLETNPTHGSLSRDEQGNLIYNPFDGYAGSDSFTYRLTGNDGETSNLATVNLEILNAAPQIQTIALPNTATEGTPLSFTAEATDPGNDTLTYTWTFSDGSTPLTGQTIAHTFADNGDYTVTLTVSDPYGGTVSQTQTLSVDNTAPTIAAITGSTIIDEGQSIQLSAIATDPGDDTLTYEWNFGDGSFPITGSATAAHTYRDKAWFKSSRF